MNIDGRRCRQGAADYTLELMATRRSKVFKPVLAARARGNR